MIVKASRDISAGEELNISYTPPMLNTPVRQMILTQTKVKDLKYISLTFSLDIHTRFIIHIYT